VEHNNKQPSIVICHSLGCNVFHYFLDWLETNFPSTWENWVDKHITMHYVTPLPLKFFFLSWSDPLPVFYLLIIIIILTLSLPKSVSAPFLGATESIKGMLVGMTFGLPIPQRTARNMGASWSSSFLLLPRNPDDVRSGAEDNVGPRPRWVESPVVIKFPSGEVLHFNIQDITSGKMFTVLKEKIPDDPFFEKFLHSLDKHYNVDPLQPIYGGAKRPPIRNIVCIYGTDVETDVGYHFTYRELLRPNIFWR